MKIADDAVVHVPIAGRRDDAVRAEDSGLLGGEQARRSGTRGP